MIVPKGTKKKFQHWKTIDKLTTMLLEYQIPQRVNAQGQQLQRVVITSTDSHASTSHKVI
jgi:hypothetical protein